MINLMTLENGVRLRLRNGSEGEVIDNVGDGIWVQMRMTRDAQGQPLDEEELVHCEDIAGLAD